MSTERVKIGIDGLDAMMGGGLISKSIGVIIGTYGTGKTTFSLNFIWEGLEKEENVIYISLEESKDRIQTYMKQKGWDIEDYLDRSLHILKLDPTDFNIAK